MKMQLLKHPSKFLEGDQCSKLSGKVTSVPSIKILFWKHNSTLLVRNRSFPPILQIRRKPQCIFLPTLSYQNTTTVFVTFCSDGVSHVIVKQE